MSEVKLTIANAEKRRVPCLVFSRVVGFLTPVQYWNDGKKSEWAERKVFTLPSASQIDAHIKTAPPAEKPAFWLPEDWAG